MSHSIEKETICHKLRETAKEFGQESLNSAVIVGPDIGYNEVGGHEYITIPTLGSYKLGKISFKVARFFENV